MLRHMLEAIARRRWDTRAAFGRDSCSRSDVISSSRTLTISTRVRLYTEPLNNYTLGYWRLIYRLLASDTEPAVSLGVEGVFVLPSEPMSEHLLRVSDAELEVTAPPREGLTSASRDAHSAGAKWRMSPSCEIYRNRLSLRFGKALLRYMRYQKAAGDITSLCRGRTFCFFR